MGGQNERQQKQEGVTGTRQLRRTTRLLNRGQREVDPILLSPSARERLCTQDGGTVMNRDHELPTFIISVGTQVVLPAVKRLPKGKS
jgi:hypothetical protein